MIMFGIDYDDETQDSYVAVFATERGEEIARFDSGDPVKDWNSMVEHFSSETSVLIRSSCDHFLMDGDKYGRDWDTLLMYEVAVDDT